VFWVEFGGENCLVPTPVLGDLAFVDLSIWGGACGLVAPGRAYCWGEGTYGQLGNGQAGYGTYSVEPVAVVGGLTFRSITAGATHACGLTDAGRAHCWGNNFRGYLGVDPLSMGLSPEPVAVTGDHRFEVLAAGSWHTCGLTDDGDVWCWGSGQEGKLGRDSALGDSYVPLRVPLN
jgi:alpha-tubulin suppressor-like RCC1 family protein